MPCSWEGNRRSGVALAMRRRLKWFIHRRADSLDREMCSLVEYVLFTLLYLCVSGGTRSLARTAQSRSLFSTMGLCFQIHTCTCRLVFFVTAITRTLCCQPTLDLESIKSGMSSIIDGVVFEGTVVESSCENEERSSSDERLVIQNVGEQGIIEDQKFSWGSEVEEEEVKEKGENHGYGAVEEIHHINYENKVVNVVIGVFDIDNYVRNPV